MNIAHQRLYHQRISYSDFKTPAEVVAWLGALQGQDYYGAKWSVGLRLPGNTDAQIEQAFENKTIVRTWAMRGTLHFVTAADIRWIVGLVAPRVIAGNGSRYRQLELDEVTLLRTSEILANALTDGKQLDRNVLRAIVEENGISTQGQRFVYMLERASLDGFICQGAAVKNVPTFMSMDALPKGKDMEQEEALIELARRYFTSRGPATAQDFAYWSGMRLGDAKTALEALKSELLQETINGQSYWLSPENPRPPESLIYLLPGFDEYLLSYKDRSAVLEPQHAQKVCPGSNGMFSPTVVIDGQMVGTWKRTFKKDGVQLDFEPFTSFTVEKEALIAAAKPYGDYLDLAVMSQNQ